MTNENEQVIETAATATAFVLGGPQIAALVNIAAQLLQQVEAIRASNTAAWELVSQDYIDAVKAWEQASTALVVQEPVAQPVAQPEVIAQPAPVAGHYNDARTKNAPAPSQGNVTISLSDGVQAQT